MSMFKGTIYALSDFSDNVFYIGCTKNTVTIRISSHIIMSKHGKETNLEKQRIIKSLNNEVKVFILDEINTHLESELFNLEKKWIDKFISKGYNLCNIATKNPT